MREGTDSTASSTSEDVAASDESALVDAVALTPVSVAIEADQSGFQLYSGGVFDDAECGTTLDHGVLVVGYTGEPDSARAMRHAKRSLAPSLARPHLSPEPLSFR